MPKAEVKVFDLRTIMEAGERIGLNQRVLHSVCVLLLVTGLSPNGSEVWFLKWERRSRDTSQGWEREMRKSHGE